MKKGDYEIGPCFTIPTARGKGLYTKVLNYITGDLHYQNASFYMLVNKNNLPSVKGIERAGFSLIGHAGRTSFLKIYHEVKVK